jgi:hypothetical protein
MNKKAKAKGVCCLQRKIMWEFRGKEQHLNAEDSKNIGE